MLKKLLFTVGSFVVAAGVASAGPLVLTVTGAGWSNPSSGVCADIDNRPGQLQDEIRWNGEQLLQFAETDSYTTQGDACGLVDAETGQPFLTNVSGYNFDPTDGVVSVLPGTTSAFSLGTFQHLNQPISDAITSVDYQLNLGHNDLTAPPANPLALNMTFLHNETDNVPTDADPNCCADIVTVVLPPLDTFFQVGGDMYQFTLLGFSPTGANGTFTNQYTSLEGGTNTTQLWAQVSPIPEPATLTLLGTGLLGLASAARRRRRRQKLASASPVSQA